MVRSYEKSWLMTWSSHKINGSRQPAYMQLLSSRAFFSFFTFIWECCCSVRWRLVKRWFLISSTCVKCGALLGSCILKHFSRYCPDYFLLKSCTDEKSCNAKKQAFFIINIIGRDYDCRRWVICTMMQLVWNIDWFYSASYDNYWRQTAIAVDGDESFKRRKLLNQLVKPIISLTLKY